MRVLFVTGSFPPMICGVGDYTARLVAETSKRGDLTIGVLTSVGAGDLTEQAVEVHPLIHHWRFRELPKIIRAIRQWRPDIIHIQYPTLGYGNKWMPYFLPLVLSCLGFVVIQTWHEPPTRFRFFPNALTKDVLIGVEPNFVQLMRKRYRRLMRRKVVHYIPIGSNIARIKLTAQERIETRARFVSQGRAMIAYFGFAYPAKGIETLFEIADPSLDTIVLITQLDPKRNPYHLMLSALVNQPKWVGKVVITGYLDATDVARVLYSADAVVFPFLNGVGMRNGSFLAARDQGTFTLTTSKKLKGYDPVLNVYYCQPGNIEEMRQALIKYKGFSLEYTELIPYDWADVADSHILLYRILNTQGSFLAERV
jgi:glycosyltransferase involved in cell wall biosynthesis